VIKISPIGLFTGYQPKDRCNDLEANRLLAATRLTGSLNLAAREISSLQKIKIGTPGDWGIISLWCKGTVGIARAGVLSATDSGDNHQTQCSSKSLR
jgi:hypothetical protein